MTWWPNWLPATANIAEVAWTASTALGATVAAIGAGLTTENFRAARRAYRRACTATMVNRLHLDLTAQDVRNETIVVSTLLLLLLVLVLFVSVGILAMATPDPIRPVTREADLLETIVLVAGAAIITVAVVLLAVGSILNRRGRHRRMTYITGRLLTEEKARRQAARGQP